MSKINGLNALDWNHLLDKGEGFYFAILVDNEPVVGKVIATESRDSQEYDRKFWVVVEVSGQYFKREGHETNSSYCYGEGNETYWDSITEVRARQFTGMVYEPID